MSRRRTPVIDAGLGDFVGPKGGAFLENFEFLRTPGHSIGHMSVRVHSNGAEAVVAGDVMHHPTQVRLPEWNTVFCEFHAEAVQSRRRLLTHCADTRAQYFGMHFPGFVR